MTEIVCCPLASGDGAGESAHDGDRDALRQKVRDLESEQLQILADHDESVAEVARLTADLAALQPVIGAAEIVRDWHSSEMDIGQLDLALDELARAVDAYRARKIP